MDDASADPEKARGEADEETENRPPRDRDTVGVLDAVTVRDLPERSALGVGLMTGAAALEQPDGQEDEDDPRERVEDVRDTYPIASAPRTAPGRVAVAKIRPLR